MFKWMRERVHRRKSYPIDESAQRRSSPTESIYDKLYRGMQEEPSIGWVYEDSVLRLDLMRHTVKIRGEAIELRPTEFRLLHVLVQNAGIVMSTSHLLDLIWNEADVNPSIVRTNIGFLRKKLGNSPTQLIKTVREFGYRYDPPMIH